MFESIISNYFFLIQLVVLLPILLIIWVPKNKIQIIKKLVLFGSYFVVIFVILLGILLDYSSVFNFFFLLTLPWININNFIINYSVSIDSFSWIFLLLVTLLIPLTILSSWNNIKFHLKSFLSLILLVEWILLNMFIVVDLFLFYVWFEAVLIPMYLLIGIWGSRQRKTYASFMFFFYTYIGSLFLLFGLFLLYDHMSSLNLFTLIENNYKLERTLLIWFFLMIAFAVKVPMFPAHIWLPEAHVEAPTVGSVLLAGVLLKLGIFAVIRFLIPIFPTEMQYFSPFFSIFALIGIIYISLTTIRQIDLKKIIAYASVAHMNYVVLGVFGVNMLSFSGSIFLMIGHGIVSAGLFFLIGFLYDRYKTRNIRYYRGLVAFMPIYALSFFIFSLANMSFPGTCNFIGEAIILFGLTQTNLLVSWFAAVGIIFCAIYTIWLFNRTMYGPITPFILSFSDLSKKEFFVVLPLLLLTFLLGIFPNIIFNLLDEFSYITLEYYNY